jgi:hypothetical protein
MQDTGAAQPVAIDLSPMLTAPGVAACQALDELAHRVDIRRWMVAGGMMVMLHGQRYGVGLPRTTTDADVVVDVRAFGRDAMRRVAAQLEDLGFGVEASPDQPSTNGSVAASSCASSPSCVTGWSS